MSNLDEMFARRDREQQYGSQYGGPPSQYGQRPGGNAPFANLIIGALRIMLFILFFTIILGGLLAGVGWGSAMSYRGGEGFIVIGLLVGLLLGVMYAVIITGFGFIMLDMRRLLKKLAGEL